MIGIENDDLAVVARLLSKVLYRRLVKNLIYTEDSSNPFLLYMRAKSLARSAIDPGKPPNS